MSEFDYVISLEVQFRDLDPMGHVNNVDMAAYIEQGRLRYIEEVVGEPVMETGAVIANLSIEYERPIDWGDEVTVAVKATDIGTTSLKLAYEVRVGDDLAASAETRMVTYDREAGQPRPLPDHWREAITAHEGL
ncbi:acyl-CoA thioesterase [Halobacteriales archaeon Cl-PHB]